MVTFRDVKDFFHLIGDAFDWAGVAVQGWPWPLSYLRDAFYYIRDWFYWGDWIWDGLQYWILVIQNDAAVARYWADLALSQVTQALNWINTTGNTLSAQMTYTMNLATNAWIWIVDVGYALAAQTLDFEAALEALRSEMLSWLASQLYGLRDELLSELSYVRAALETADLELDTRLKDLGLRMEPIALWDVLSPGLVEKLIEELDKKW